MDDDGRIEVRATINLPGLPRGHVARVDPDDPYVAACLSRRFLEPLDAEPEE